jgi:Resolvase, N terminal domain
MVKKQRRVSKIQGVESARPADSTSPAVRTHSRALRRHDVAGGRRHVALYLRVSTLNGQTTENQRRELEAVAERSGWRVTRVYEDVGMRLRSGSLTWLRRGRLIGWGAHCSTWWSCLGSCRRWGLTCICISSTWTARRRVGVRCYRCLRCLRSLSGRC